MRRSNPRSDRRPTLVMAAVHLRVRSACRGRQAREAGRRRPRALSVSMSLLYNIFGRRDSMQDTILLA